MNDFFFYEDRDNWAEAAKVGQALACMHTAGTAPCSARAHDTRLRARPRVQIITRTATVCTRLTGRLHLTCCKHLANSAPDSSALPTRPLFSPLALHLAGTPSSHHRACHPHSSPPAISSLSLPFPPTPQVLSSVSIGRRAVAHIVDKRIIPTIIDPSPGEIKVGPHEDVIKVVQPPSDCRVCYDVQGVEGELGASNQQPRSM